jgi:uncharacterized protein (TIGR03663 family)
MNRWVALGVLLATAVALGLRCPRLGIRPIHNDEAVNAVKFGQLWEQGAYRYDPREFHGPTLAYATKVFGKLTAAPDFRHFSESRLRLLTVLFGVTLILLLPLISDGLGRNGTIWAGFLTAVSPAMVFYSRYYIHEMLLVFFTFLALAASWRYWRTRKPGWAVLAGLGLGLMHATKETFVIAVVAASLALAANHIWNRIFDASKPPLTARPLNWRHVAAGGAVWLLIAVALFSSFGANPRGLADSFRTYAPWLGRVEGASPHIYPWYFYFQRLLFFHPPGGPVWSEGLIAVLALVGGAAGFARRGLSDANASFVRFLALYAFLLAGAYSFIAYKTPWCLLGFWHAAILLAGVGAGVLITASKFHWARLAMKVALTIGILQLAAQAWQASASERLSGDRRNPYVFAQTSRSILELVSKVEGIVRSQPAGRDTVIKVMAPENDFWPLPWYLRKFDHVFLGNQISVDPYSTIMIVSKQFNANLDQARTHLMVGYFELRPGVFFELYVELEAWKTYLAKNPAVREQQ